MTMKRFRVGPGLGLFTLILASAPLLGGCAPVVVGAGASVGVAVAQERSLKDAVSDVKIQAQINHLFFQESQALFTRVNLQIHEGRVLMSGNVPSPLARLMAVRLTWQAKGVRQVINELNVKPPKVAKKVKKRREPKSSTATAAIPDQDTSRKTSEVPPKPGQEATEVTGAQKADLNTDSEAVGDLSTVTESARDIWISTQIKAKILADSQIRSINYSVVTVNQEVFLMGVAQHQAELDRVTNHAKGISYVRRVVNFVRLKDQPVSAQ